MARRKKEVIFISWYKKVIEQFKCLFLLHKYRVHKVILYEDMACLKATKKYYKITCNQCKR